jgi:hypothetical protein
LLLTFGYEVSKLGLEYFFSLSMGSIEGENSLDRYAVIALSQWHRRADSKSLSQAHNQSHSSFQVEDVVQWLLRFGGVYCLSFLTEMSHLFFRLITLYPSRRNMLSHEGEIHEWNRQSLVSKTWQNTRQRRIFVRTYTLVTRNYFFLPLRRWLSSGGPGSLRSGPALIPSTVSIEKLIPPTIW